MKRIAGPAHVGTPTTSKHHTSHVALGIAARVQAQETAGRGGWKIDTESKREIKPSRMGLRSLCVRGAGGTGTIDIAFRSNLVPQQMHWQIDADGAWSPA